MLKATWKHNEQKVERICTVNVPPCYIAKRQLFVQATRQCHKIAKRPKSAKNRPKSAQKRNDKTQSVVRCLGEAAARVEKPTVVMEHQTQQQIVIKPPEKKPIPVVLVPNSNHISCVQSRIRPKVLDQIRRML